MLAVPRTRLADDDSGKREWKSALLPAYRRLSRRAELLIAEVCLAGVNMRRVRRALQALFAGRIGKGAVSRAWRRTARHGRPGSSAGLCPSRSGRPPANRRGTCVR